MCLERSRHTEPVYKVNELNTIRETGAQWAASLTGCH